ncbi:DUF4139 domain-containing protein [Phyllobacterium sp. TAF24]|uniref:DUF4139 domain-containing protein n=1 Tax=Phyllobacterium sp. TAF24 TaxID=3233068 RepID=UPI003F9E1C19
MLFRTLFVVMNLITFTGTTEAAELVLKRAVLGTGGMGYFEYSAEVTGKEKLTLRARLDQVDDILKSMLILDPAGAGSATLPGKTGAEETFASLPFTSTDLVSMPALISALKGAEIKLAGPRKLEGRILSIQMEMPTAKVAEISMRTRVAVFSGSTIEQFILEEAEGLEFKDARMAQQVETALKALHTAQDRSSRDITIQLAEGGKRTVRVGYVTEAPVWKAAYRLTLPKPGEDSAKLQGWVVLENMTGNPWKDVAVTLSSASPVTFRQALYDPYYVSRPEIAPPVSRVALPRVDPGQNAMGQNVSQLRETAPQLELNKAIASSTTDAPSLQSARQYDEKASSTEARKGDFSQPQKSGNDSEENAAGASFILSQTVSAGSGESLTIPFVDIQLPSQAVTWYQGISRNPWSAMTIKNNGPTSLPAGSATIYEMTEAGPLFSGEAQFPLLPKDDFRLIGFGSDQKVIVDSQHDSTSAITSFKAIRGALHIESRLRQTTTYIIKNGASELRHLVIEQPRETDWQLVEPKADSATIAGPVYRLRLDINAGISKQFKVVMERQVIDAIEIGSLSSERIRALMAAPELDAETKARLAPVMDAARISDEAQAEVTRLEDQREGITTDQERIRENLNSAPQGSNLARLYSQKMVDQEKALDKLNLTLNKARDKLDAAAKTLTERVSSL